ncbi:single-stranded DNA-binding protein (plasmid) [Polymorphobacter sp. PAMC 29334]|uniref:single-stranded DNA-binding protein n=1 Tax=Polymorphobacter sp. PAMC 29334 TaxID=2862331 RepID=UPI001C66BA0F|nr:single-stranded DNA-binding protein [Polymorphobacter sp. PAMC 29334]QYE33159.1 single-stranded DNA-binding protein [Polymorphobacter sp. PAMC 29334]
MTNLVIIIGNAGADPVSRSIQAGGTVTSLSVATSTKWTDKNTGEIKEQTEWHRVTCFNGLGTNVAKYVRKGSKVSIQGRLHYTSWTGTDGATKYGVEILADSVEFLTPAPKAGDAPKRETRTETPARTPATTGGLDDLDDDVPF